MFITVADITFRVVIGDPHQPFGTQLKSFHHPDESKKVFIFVMLHFAIEHFLQLPEKVAIQQRDSVKHTVSR